MPSYTLEILRGKVYTHVDNNTRFYASSEVDVAINDAIRTLNLYVGFLQGSASAGNSDAGRYFYDVPGTILFPLAVYYDNRRLARCSLPALAMRHRDWLRQTTANDRAVRNWIPLGIRKFGIHPADAVGGRSLVVEGVLEPVPLSDDADIVQLDDSSIDTVENLAAHTLMLKEGGKIFADASLQYQEFLRLMKSLERWKEMRHPRYFVTERESEKVPA